MHWPILLGALAGVLCGSAPLSARSCSPAGKAAEDQRALNAFWGRQAPLCRLPSGSFNAYANLSDGAVYADPDWLDLVARRFGAWAATGILAHEWGHLVQRRSGGTASELQADCLAGVFMRGRGLGREAIEQFVAVNRFAARAPHASAGHGTPQQRVNAALRGYALFGGDSSPAVLARICPFSAR